MNDQPQPQHLEPPLSERLRVLRDGSTLDEALDLFDHAEPVRVEDLAGFWHGSGFATDHPLDGLLEAYGWDGKRVEGEDAHPLIFRDRIGQFAVNPGLLPVALAARVATTIRNRPVALLTRPLLRATRTTKPRARLHMTGYRGVVSAAMTYNALPITDHFRRIDGSTLLGVMEYAALERPFVFVLCRES